MDINSLLSPSETPRNSLTPGPANGGTTPIAAQPQAHSQSPYKHVQRTQSGSSAMINSPLGRSIQPASSIPAHIRSPSQQPLQTSPLISPVPAGTATSHLPRTSSAPAMETLADFTSSKVTPPLLSSRDSLDSQKSLSSLFPHLASTGATSNPRGSIDINMVDTPKQQVRADYSDTSLSVDAQQRLAVVAAYVQESPSSYEAHKEIIKLLHQGFIDHIYPPSDPNARREPRAYDLLPDLRQARENLDKLFAVGEEQWLDWLQDESILAQTAEERTTVISLCQRAVTEEYGSTKLWITYGDWVLHCHKWAESSSGNLNAEIDAERLVGRDVFDWKRVLDAWNEGLERTKHDLLRSHEVWNKFMAVRFKDINQLSSSDAEAALELFERRLRIPHATWPETFQAFSSFVSANAPKQYEDIMASNLRDSAAAKKIWADRDTFESALSAAQSSENTTAEYQAFTTYIEWERDQENNPQPQKRGKNKRLQDTRNSHFDLVDSLYQRAELRFPSVVTVWEEHIDYLIEKQKPGLSETLIRATKHCPWSGSLWKQYILTSELAEDPFDETEKIKHKATSTGLLDAGGIEEVILVHDAWCGYLLRRSKRPDATEEDSDLAQMGIPSSIEAVDSCASNLGIGRVFDPSFRLKRKYIEYLRSREDLDDAGAQFNGLANDYGNFYKFWLRYYEFEMQKSIQMAQVQRAGPERVGNLSSAPFAVGILKRALQQPELDYPEPIVEALLKHCEDYEDAEELQSATLLAHRVHKSLATKRQREALQAGEVAAQKQQAEEEVAHRTQEVANGLYIGKRKREEDNEEDENTKRQRNEATEQSVENNAVEEDVKRDREHASVLIQNVPLDVSTMRIRQYFSSCGTIKQVKPVQDDEHSFIVEFEEAEAANFALSRNGREFEGATLSVILNTGSTLFVANYPATADEAYVRNLFRSYGEIINVRFPSLLRNKKRRFCYVEFKHPIDAQAATEIDGKEIDGVQLVAKISEPGARQTRQETSDDGRKVFVGQIPFKAKRNQVENFFAKFGTIQHVKFPQDEKSMSRNRGIAFLTFASQAEALAAVGMNGEEFMGRKITVSLTSERDNRSIQSANSRSPSVSTRLDAPGPSKPPRIPNNDDLVDRRERTVAISGVPDTVNQSRIRAAAEKFGTVRKIVLKTSHQGALVEYESIPDAGRAMIGLENMEIDPGRHFHVTTEKEMMQQKPELKTDQFVKRPNSAESITASAPVRRPAQAGARKRGGHLGMRSSVLLGPIDKGDSKVDGERDTEKKSNDHFRDLVNKG